MLTSNSATSLITKPTKVTPSTATIIDHVLTNENRLILTPFVIKYTLTDHYPIMISVSQETNNTRKNQYKLVRSFSKFSVVEFIKDLQIKFNEFWQKISTITDKNIETIFEQFYTLINQNIKHAPLKKASRKQKRLQNKPWITKGLYKSIKKKQKMYKTHYINGSLKEKYFYKRNANILTRMKNLAKKLYFHHILDESKNNPQKT